MKEELERFCSRCKEVKFKTSNPRRTWCQPCRYKWENQDPRQRLIRQKKCHAKKLGIEFSLTVDNVYFPTHCPVLGMELAYKLPGGLRDNCPSFDRLDPAKGYTAENVVVMSHRANTLKNTATIEELEAVINWMRSQGQ